MEALGGGSMKVIRDDKSYAAALARIGELAALDPSPDSVEGEELEVLSILVEDYERRVHSIEAPTPLEAIRFRMGQAGLSQKDLVPYIGSKSKTSEVLSGKRPLSLPMVRALSDGLGIPIEVLVQDDAQSAAGELDPSRFPVRESKRRNWFPSVCEEDLPVAVVSALDSFGGNELLLAARASSHVRSGRDMDPYALMTWAAWVVLLARSQPPAAEFDSEACDESFLSAVAKLSASEGGPLKAREFLSGNGVSLVVADHLPRTYLDGALILGAFPIVALSLRYDRVDGFWFTLLHELAHLYQFCHSGRVRSFFDDLDVDSADEVEVEADALAGEALIPKASWAASPASNLRTPEAVEHLAKQLGIHPAIVAGRIRHESGDYRKLSRMVGQGQVRRLFDEAVER
jgi:HTH-type transcriptional regulator/antitoxin HigA